MNVDGKSIFIGLLLLLNAFTVYQAYEMKERIRQLEGQKGTSLVTDRQPARYTGPADLVAGDSLSVVTVFPETSCQKCIVTDLKRARRLHERFPGRVAVAVRPGDSLLIREARRRFPGPMRATNEAVTDPAVDATNPYSLTVVGGSDVVQFHRNDVENPHNQDNRDRFFHRAESLLKRAPTAGPEAVANR
jgi:hypothetical protein